MKRPPKETPALYAQDGRGYDATVHAHYFVGSCDWLVTEYDAKRDLAFGWTCLGGDRQNAELGQMDLAELESVRAPVGIVVDGETRRTLGLAVDYDEHWQPISLRDAIERLDKRSGRA